MRLFIAINFEDQVKDKIFQVQSRVREYSQKGNYSREQNFHLTLIFLGELEEAQLPVIEEAINNVSWEAFEVTFSRLGYFKRDGGDLWWIGLDKTPALMALQRDLSKELEQRGFMVEHRAFQPHLTLARQVFSDRGMDLHIEPFRAQIRQVSLMKSERLGSQLVYNQVYQRHCHSKRKVGDTMTAEK